MVIPGAITGKRQGAGYFAEYGIRDFKGRLEKIEGYMPFSDQRIRAAVGCCNNQGNVVITVCKTLNYSS